MQTINKAFFILTVGMLLASCGHSISNQSDDQQNNEDIMNVEKFPISNDGIIRLSKIEVFPEYLQDYLEYAVEVGRTSLLVEPGVLTMYAMQDKADSCKITILETYASEEAYQEHIKSDHFQKYKQGTLHMVKSLELCDQTPLNQHSVLTNTIQ